MEGPELLLGTEDSASQQEAGSSPASSLPGAGCLRGALGGPRRCSRGLEGPGCPGLQGGALGAST